MKQMKKFFVLLLCGVLCLNLCGCGNTIYMNDHNVTDDHTSQNSPGTDPSDPADTPGPSDPSGPEEPSLPTEPTDPDDPPKEDPTEPTGPDDPPKEDPTEPTDPDDPPKEDPTEPTDPDDPPDKDPPDNPPAEPDDGAEREKYSYRPQIFNKIPTVSINTSDGSDDFITKPVRNDKLAGTIDYVTATVSVDGPGEYDLSAGAQVKARGNYTLDYEKKPVRIKFDQKQNLLGLNGGQKFTNWVLLADYKDLSSLNNATALYLGQTILGSDGYYCSDFCTVELTVNGKYWGVYLLAEQQEAKEGRANAVEADDGETGIGVGYLMEYDGYYTDEQNIPNNGGDPTFTVNYGGNLTKQNENSYSPWQTGYTVKSDLQSEEQRLFLQSFTENAFRIVRSAAYDNKSLRFNADYTGTEPSDCSPREAIEAVIDVDSLADTYILQEVSCDPDIAWSSFYISLDMRENGKKKLVFEAPWDYDSAFGIKWNTANGAYGMYAANSENPWFSVIIHMDFFQTLIREKWAKLAKYGVFKNALSLICEETEAYGGEFAKNLGRWPGRLSSGNGELTYEMNEITTQDGAAEHLCQWLYTRLNYLNSVFGDGKDVLTESAWQPGAPSAPSAEQHRFEAEDCDYSDPMRWDNAFRGASGGAFLGQIEGSDPNRLITLTVNAPEETDAYLGIGLSKRAFPADFSDWFALLVNGKKIWLPPCIIGACGKNEEEWGAWTAIGLGYIHLQRGENTIVLNTVSNVATNLDYFDLYCDCSVTMISNR